MVGIHSIPVIVDAYLKGFRGFDAVAAYQCIKESITQQNKGFECEAYDKYGFLPFDITKGGSVSRLVEHGYDDYCAAQFAKALGKNDDAAFFAKRAGYYKNVFDPETKFLRGKDTKGNWRSPFDPVKLSHWGSDYVEGNAWQYTWHVMQDPEGLIQLMGGKQAFSEKLSSLFVQPQHITGEKVLDVTGLIGQYAHGNEPSHHVIYFFNYANDAWKGEELVRKVFETQYKNTQDGLCGNDDCGQMSAWYIFSAMGFYPFNPCNDGYTFGAPQLPKITLALPGGKHFTVEAKGLSEANKYVKSVTLNGNPVTGFKLAHRAIMTGGSLVFEMSPTPAGCVSGK
jgi:predicted alpha-1,2-mannosidase